MASQSPDPHPTVETLQAELTDTRAKFTEWKTKVRQTVEKERQQILQLASELESTKKFVGERNAFVALLQSTLYECTEPVRSPPIPSFSSWLTQTTALLYAICQRKSTIALDAQSAVFQATFSERLLQVENNGNGSRQSSSTLVIVSSQQDIPAPNTPIPGSTPPLPSPTAPVADEATILRAQLSDVNINFEKFKKRAEQTIRLSSKEVQDQKKELSESSLAVLTLQKQIEELHGTISQKESALTASERQLDGATSTIAFLQNQLDALSTSLRTTESKTQMSVDVEKVREEFAAREEIIFDQHRDEIDRLVASQESELNRIRTEHVEELRVLRRDIQLLRQAPPPHAETGHSPSSGNPRAHSAAILGIVSSSTTAPHHRDPRGGAHHHHHDAAYESLLTERSALIEKISLLEKQNNQLTESMRGIRLKYPQLYQEMKLFFNSSSSVQISALENNETSSSSSSAISRAVQPRNPQTNDEEKETSKDGEDTKSQGPTTTTTSSSVISGIAAHQRISELEKQVKTMSDQLWTLNHQLLDAKAAQHHTAHFFSATVPSSSPVGRSSYPAGQGSFQQSGSSGSSGVGANQQVSYLKSVLIKLLCARGDDVRSNLIPVLATLMGFDAEELRAVYSANPSWIKK